MLSNFFSLVQTILAFAVAISILVIIHEYGHYRVAVACGVKVLRFSLGFGKPLLTWRSKGGDQTEFVIAPILFGGYVRMLDERETPVAPLERHRAFNHKPIWARALVVVAGPVANLVLAVLLFASVALIGYQAEKAVLAQPSEGSLMERAGIQERDEVVSIRAGGKEAPVISTEDFFLTLTDAAISSQDALLAIKRDGQLHDVHLPLSQFGSKNITSSFMKDIGYTDTWIPPVPVITIRDLKGAAARAGLQNGDVVISVNGEKLENSVQLLTIIQSAVNEQPQTWVIERNGLPVDVSVTPAVVVNSEGKLRGKIGASLGSPEMVTIRYGLFDSLIYGVNQSWVYSGMTLQFIGKMIVGQASVKNLSGPIAIADIAGSAAKSGFIPYIKLLALISLSLGLLNLLPLPVLDGGQLVYLLVEGIRGKPLPEKVINNLQIFGVFLLIMLMLVASMNDIVRIGFRS